MTDTSIDPLAVDCPDCVMVAGRPCVTADPDDRPHTTRYQAAEFARLERGTCALCGGVLVRGGAGPDDPRRGDVYHPLEVDQVKCPPMPSPETDWNGYARALNAGAKPGWPGAEHFRPIEPCACGWADTEHDANEHRPLTTQEPTP